jgi:hypothetical protein
MTLHTLNKNEEIRFYLKKQFSGKYYQGKCGKGGINTTYPCSVTHL